MAEKVVVGMSGGVDSSVAAFLLKEKGYEVIGVTMRVRQDEEQTTLEKKDGGCGSSAIEDAARVAKVLKIPHYVMDFRDEFQQRVVDYFVDEYRSGRTPNPCIACNRYVKWEALLTESLALGADYIATGHYARITRLANGRYALQSSVTQEKDQTYALYGLTQDQLSHTLMPVGDYTKDRIRRMAEKLCLPVAHKPDSQEICFIPDGDYAGFIDREVRRRASDGTSVPAATAFPDGVVPSGGPALPDENACHSGLFQEGNFVTAQGQVLGRHRGITRYTIGQRKGLNLSLGHPVFVTQIRPETNEVVIGESGELFSKELFCNRINYMGMESLDGPRRVMGKIRYGHKGAPCRIEPVTREGEAQIRCVFEEPVRAVTPGQAAVFYEDGCVLGGGTIL